MIKLKDISFGYGRDNLFNHLSLELGPGIFGLLGKNGAGKSSLLRIIAGLLSVQSGEPRVLEQQPSARRPSFLQDVMLLTEEFYLPAVKGEEYVTLYAPFYPRFDRALFDRCAGELELNTRKKLNSLSYGQKKKFLLAFALASGTRLLLLDEPTNGLDIPSKAQFRRLVAAAWSEERCIIISTHQVRDVEELIDPIIIVENGRIIFQNSVEEINRGLKFSVSSRERVGGEVLYTEKGLGGWAVLEEGEDEPGAAVDLELLFNGVLKEPDRIARIMNQGGKK
jgi:ABC-2 type transport system ATP-binding protein